MGIYSTSSLFPRPAFSSPPLMEVDEPDVNWLEDSGEELIRELHDDRSPFVILPKVAESRPPAVHHKAIINKIISTIYSGPTISDIESALPTSFRRGRSTSQPTVLLLEKGLEKMENKSTVRIRNCENGLADDGYKWRKYGQKSIKNNPNPRSYYRCTNTRCNAKKQVERSTEEPETLIVTYEGIHLHYACSHFLLTRPPGHSAASLQAPKKPKILIEGQQDYAPRSPHMEPKTRSLPTMEQHKLSEQGPAYREESLQSQQGLLEDIVPLLVRKPCSSITSPNDPSFYSEASSPSHSSSLPWPSNSASLDVGILSGIL